MKTKYNKRRYKLQAGIQSITPDTPDYSSAYKIREEQNAKGQIGQNIGAAAANIAMPGLGSALQGVGAISDAAFKDAKGNYKSKAAEVLANQFNPLDKAGKALSALTGDKTAAADLYSGSLIGTGLGALGVKNPFGKTTQEKVKESAQEEEKRVEDVNFNKAFVKGNSTDAQSFVAKKGKYKVKSKQPRLIETEGREPIFSPPDKNGKRKLLYYNPNDPTHEEGGVKAVVMPKAQAGKKEVKIPMNVADLEKTKRMSFSKSAANRQRQEDSKLENFIELFEPSGTLSYDDVIRSYDRTGLSGETTLEAVGALPFIKYMKLLKGPKTAYKEYMLSKALRWAGKGAAADQAKDMTSEELANIKKANGASNLMPRRSKVSLLGSGNMAYGAKQLKVNDLNNAALSQNFAGMPSANVANKFIQPTAGKLQVARQIPNERRKEKIRTPRSHKTAPKDSNRIIDPPMLYEMKPPPPRSTFNTKNNFKKGGSYIRTYEDGTEAAATYKHTKTFKSKPAYQAALQAHDDSLNLYGQSRYFTDLVKRSGLYQPTVENPQVKNITKTGVGKASSPTKPFGAPDDASEDIMSIAGINPMRKDLYSRKESKYKSFKDWEDAKASGKDYEKHEGYEINMYKHPEMALRYEPDTISPMQIKKPRLNLGKDTSSIKVPSKVTVPPSDTTIKERKETLALNKSRGKFVGREKTFFEKVGEKAGEFLEKVGPSTRTVNSKKVRVFK